jgi:N-acetylmuramoyl-L-alanine amidase
MIPLKRVFVLVTLCGFFLASPAWSADLSGLKICLDPGHGAYPTIKPFETIINLQVAFFLKDYLESANADTVILTRYNNIDNPSLSQREFIANSNNVDWFNSIHHNAFNGVANYTLVLYEESPGGVPEWTEAVTMSNIMAEDIYHALYTTGWYARGDYNFLGFNLGVLNDLMMPGELTEGSFFDHPPETDRLRNDEYLKMEARALHTSFLDYFGADPLTTGTLSGAVTDDESGDPVNGVTCTLWPDSLVYTTDDSSNGLYIFDDLTPGSYTVTVDKANYTPDTSGVTVSANSFPRLHFQIVNETPPVVVYTVPADGDSGIYVYENIVVGFSRRMNQSATQAAFSILPSETGSFSWDPQGQQMTFDPSTYLDHYTIYQVTIAGTATDTYGHPLDGDGNGSGGDAYVFNFKTAHSDTVSPQVVATEPGAYEEGVETDVILVVEFDELLDPSSVNTSNVLLRDSGMANVLRTVEYMELDNHGFALIYVTGYLDPSETYTATVTTGIQDPFLNNLESDHEWSFSTRDRTYQLTLIDDFNNGVSPWWDPEGSGSTTGTVPESTSFSTEYSIKNPITSSTAAGELDYLWNTGAGSWLIREYFPPPSSDVVHFDTSYTLEVYLYGDGLDNKFRFCVDDNLPATSASYHEVSSWITVDWKGWRLVKWDLGSDPVGAWLGNGILEGDMRVDSFQMTYNSSEGNPSGTIYLDDLRVAQLGADLSPPEAIDDLAAYKSGDDLYLSWSQPYDGEGVVRYMIYRSTDPTSPGDSLIGTVDTDHTDVGVVGDVVNNYFYTVKSEDGAENKSEASNEVGEMDKTLTNGE